MKFIIGKKLEMSQRYRPNGEVVPVTMVKVEPCTVTQVKTSEKDGYVAVQLGTGTKKRLPKAQAGHLGKNGALGTLREFRVQDAEGITVGMKCDETAFEAGDIVKVTGTSKGKGFQGVVKRHGFHGSPASHGHKDQLRMPGSIGSTGPQRVFKGTRMAGHMGSERVTVKNLEVVAIEAEDHKLAIKGAVPGARGSLVLVSGEGEMKFIEEAKEAPAEEVKAEDKTEEAPAADEAKAEEVKEEAPAEEKKEEPKQEEKKEEEKPAEAEKKEEAPTEEKKAE